MAAEFILLIRESEEHTQLAEAEREAAQAEIHAAHSAFFQAITELGGTFVGGAGLQPTSAAVRIVPARDGHPAIFTDGPFTETKEVVSGYYKVTAPDADAARAIAAKCPTHGWIELYPVADVGM